MSLSTGWIRFWTRCRTRFDTPWRCAIANIWRRGISTALRAHRRRARVQFLDANAAALRADRDTGAFTADFTVVRALLRPGRAYEDAVAMFAPYDQIRDENPEAREALRALIQRMREERRAAYIFVNNRLEGNAPETIRAVVDE